MRWFLRRLGFYVFAIWVALTITFLLPRLMPGDPIGGVLQHLSPQQIESNPGIIQTYRDLLGGGDQSIWSAYGQYLHRVATLNFGISTSNYPTKVSEVVGHLGIGPVPQGGCQAELDPAVTSLGISKSFTGLVIVYFLGLKLGWFPIQHAYDNGATPGMNWDFISSAARHGVLPALTIVVAFAGGWVLNMRTVMINTISEDYVAMGLAKGLRDRRVMIRYAARNAILPPLNGFAAQFATAVGGVIFIELVFSYPGAGYTLQQAALGNDYALTQALLLVFALCPIVANFIMDVLNLILDPRVRAA